MFFLPVQRFKNNFALLLLSWSGVEGAQFIKILRENLFFFLVAQHTAKLVNILTVNYSCYC